MGEGELVEPVGGAGWTTPPSGQELMDWFVKNVPISEKLDHGDYFSGLVVISNVERRPVDAGDRLEWQDTLVHKPYMRVETKIQYWWDLQAAEDLFGEVTAPTVTRVKRDDYYNMHLPPGFFVHTLQDREGPVEMVGCSKQALLYDNATRTIQKKGSVGTKVVPMHTSSGPNPDAISWAETGSLGRALTNIGVLIVPGAGIASAEDMLHPRPKAQAQAQLPPEGSAAELTADEMRAEALRLLGILREKHPTEHTEFSEWAKGRKIKFDSAKPFELKAAVIKLERLLDKAQLEPTAGGKDAV